MKYSFGVLVMLAMLAASQAWSAEDQLEQCMEACLAPAIESGDPDVIDAAIPKCVAQCSGPLEAVGSNDAASVSGMSVGRCMADCSSKHRQCLRTMRDPLKCQIRLENCRQGCFR